MDTKQPSAQRGSVAHPASGPQILHIIGDKRHSGPADEGVGRSHSLLHTPLGILLQQLGHLQHDHALSGGNELGVDTGDVIPALRRNLRALIGAGGNGGIGQI